MTVGELIEKLKEFDKDQEVKLDTDEGRLLLKLDDVYETIVKRSNEKTKIVTLYGSLFNVENRR